jgi:hypothetical protein
MRLAFLAAPLAVSVALFALPARATNRSFVYAQESRVLAPGESELEPWTTFRAGRSRYYSAIDGRLELEHGLARGLQLALYWNFSTQTQDVEQDSLTRELVRVTDSEFASASAELKYQLSDPTADVLGSALYLETTLGPRESELEGKLILDRSIGKWLLAANLNAELELEPTRDAEGSELETGFVLEPILAAAYALPHGVSVGVELRAPLGLAGEAESRTLFGGPVARFSDRGFWAALGVQPQLAAFSGQSADSRLDLRHHERLEVRLLAGFVL